MDKITEIIPDNIPKWAADAIDRGDFFKTAIAQAEQSELLRRKAKAFDWIAKNRPIQVTLNPIKIRTMTGKSHGNGLVWQVVAEGETVLEAIENTTTHNK
ncbi:MAG: hypothetical protein ACYSSO_07415 [Planctomycetota bacterium]|jgi:hypothetical protein